MAFCTNCSQQVADGSKFCSNCGSPISYNASNIERKIVFDGEIHKCPNCGEILKAFEIVCHTCKFELRGVKGSSVVDDLAKKLENATSEKQRITTIRTFPVPNTKEDIFEFMVLASSSFDVSYYATHLHEEDISDAWLTKIEQCYQKAKLLFGDNSDFERIESVYLTIKNNCAEKERKIKYEQKAQQSARERAEEAALFKESKVRKITIIFAIISALCIAIAFNNGRIAAGFIAIGMFASFIVAFLMGSGVITEKVKNLRLIPVIIGFILIIPYFSLYSTSITPLVNWDEIELREYVPNLDKKGNVEENTETSLHIKFVGLTESDHNQALKEVKAMGYTNVKFTNSVYYNAYNEDEYYLEVWWHAYSGEMDFYLDAPTTMSTIDWTTLILASELPIINSNEGIIRTNTSEKLDILVDDIYESIYNNLVEECKARWFTIDVVVDSETGNFEAFNNSGTKIVLKYNKLLHNLDITLEIAESYSTFVWPSTKLVKTLPKPGSNVGKITISGSDSFTVKVANTSFSDFQAYVNKCIEKGYNDYYWSGETLFRGEKSKGYTLTVKYLGYNVMEIHVYK